MAPPRHPAGDHAQIVTYAVPPSLYRFRSLSPEAIDYEMDALEKGYIYCAHYSQMNDPMEGSHAESAMLSAFKGRETTIGRVIDARDSLGIASLTEACDHEPMWAHYADKFAGICIKFNFKRLMRALPSNVEFVRVAYNETPPVLLLDGATAERRAKMILSTKSVRWATEREWRLFSPTVGPLPYEGKNVVTAIYLGSQITDANRKRFIAVAARLGVPIHTMALDKYTLSFKRLALPPKPKRPALAKPKRPRPVKPKKLASLKLDQ